MRYTLLLDAYERVIHYLKMNIKSKTYSPNQENQKYIWQIYQDYVSLIEEKNRLSL